MSVIYPKGNAVIAGNLTPMIDMVFLLIVFFVLVSRIVDRERVDLNLPQPHQAATVRPGEEHRVVINVMPGPRGTVRGYRAGGRDYPADANGVASLAQQLTALLRTQPTVNMNVRADRGTYYEHVEPVIAAVGAAARAAGVPAARVNLVVVEEQ